MLKVTYCQAGTFGEVTYKGTVRAMTDSRLEVTLES